MEWGQKAGKRKQQNAQREQEKDRDNKEDMEGARGWINRNEWEHRGRNNQVRRGGMDTERAEEEWLRVKVHACVCVCEYGGSKGMMVGEGAWGANGNENIMAG